MCWVLHQILCMQNCVKSMLISTCASSSSKLCLSLSKYMDVGARKQVNFYSHVLWRGEMIYTYILLYVYIIYTLCNNTYICTFGIDIQMQNIPYSCKNSKPEYVIFIMCHLQSRTCNAIECPLKPMPSCFMLIMFHAVKENRHRSWSKWMQSTRSEWFCLRGVGY